MKSPRLDRSDIAIVVAMAMGLALPFLDRFAFSDDD